MAKFYLVGDIRANDLWLVNTEEKTVARVMVGDNEQIFGAALSAFTGHAGTVTLGDSEVEMTPEEVAKAIYESAMRGMNVSNVPVCIASESSVGEARVAIRDAIGGNPTTRLD